MTSACRPAGPVAVVLSRFPLLTETFILREVVEMERQGRPVVLVPLLRERAAVVHPEARPWVERALYTPWLSPAILLANLRSLGRRPRAYLATAARLLLAHARSPNLFVRTAALWPKSVYLAERLAAAGVVHVHAHYATHPATAAFAIGELAGIPWSFTAHAHDIFVRRAGLRGKLARARFVRVVSRFNGDFLAARYPEVAAKLRVVHAGIDPARYAGTGPAPAPGPPRLLCVAAFKPYKGHAVLVEACARLRAAGVRFTCELVGEGPLRAAIERLAAERGLGEAVRFLGGLPEEEVAARLAAAAVVVLPSVVARDGQMEGIPVALMEAMAAGRPVVASALSGVPELVEHEGNGLLVPPGDAPALAAAVARLLADPAWAAALGRRGRETVEAGFRLDRSVSALLALVEREPAASDAEITVRLAACGWPELRENLRVGVRRVHRREDSWVAELLVPPAGGGEPLPAATEPRREAPREIVLKIQRSRPGESYPAPRRARREFEVLRSLAAALARHPGLGVPRALHLDETAAAVVMEAARGRPLDELVRGSRLARDAARRGALGAAVRQAGEWLAALQRATPAADDPAAALGALRERAEKDLAACRGRLLWPRTARRVAARLAEGAARLDRSALRLTGHHGDFWPGNVFVAPGRVEVIDFEGYRVGLPEEDAAFFLVELELFFAWPGLARRFETLAAAFLEPLAHLDPRALEVCTLAKALQVLATAPPGGGLGGRRRRAAVRARLTAGPFGAARPSRRDAPAPLLPPGPSRRLSGPADRRAP